MRHLDRIRATTVARPAMDSTVETWNPVNRAQNTVAGNMVSTC